jgi:hypothetical protein
MIAMFKEHTRAVLQGATDIIMVAQNRSNANNTALTPGMHNIIDGVPIMSTFPTDGAFGITAAGYGWWCWGGKLNRSIPPHYQFPKGKVKTICDLFLFGIPMERSDQQYVGKARVCFQTICQRAIDLNLVVNLEAIEVISHLAWNMLFSTVLVDIVSEYKSKTLKGVGPLELISFTTFYDFTSELKHIEDDLRSLCSV